MSTRVSITCKDGDMFVRTLAMSLYTALEEMDARLDPEHGDGVTFEAFGRSRDLWADDVEQISFKVVD